MSVYGDMLLAFPEQFTTIEVYSMQPKMNGGWTVADDARSVLGVFQNTGGSRLKDSNGNLARSDAAEFWTMEGGLSGLFTKRNGFVYRLTGDNNWKAEGGFYRYSLEKVVGNDGTESEQPAWNTGGHNFG